jgi:hypothetical protein
MQQGLRGSIRSGVTPAVQRTTMRQLESVTAGQGEVDLNLRFHFHRLTHQ